MTLGLAMLACLALSLWALALCLLLVGTWCVHKHLGQRPESNYAQPPFTVLKPLKGYDPGLEANLDSFFALTYPRFEMILSVADARDPALTAARSVLARHADPRARLHVGEKIIGPNPKVNNMALPYEQAKYDWILISDSNVRADSDYLHDVAEHIRPETGVLTAIVAGTEARGLGGRLEALFLNTFYARWMCLAYFVGRPVVIGKSMLFRKSMADRFGGIEILSRYLAEDFMMGEAMRKLGLKIQLMHTPVRQNLGHRTFKEFWLRHVRWGRIRKSQEPYVFHTEIVATSVVSALAGALALWLFLGLSPWVTIAAHLSFWLLCDWSVHCLVARPSALFPFLWLVREVLGFPLWVHTALGHTVMWREKRLRLQAYGLLEPS